MSGLVRTVSLIAGLWFVVACILGLLLGRIFRLSHIEDGDE